MTGEPLLTVSDLRIHSRIGGKSRTIVSGIDLALARGETIGIVGESGSGKSMTARALIGLLPAGVFAEGHVEYEGRDLLELPERALRKLRGSELGLRVPGPVHDAQPAPALRQAHRRAAARRARPQARPGERRNEAVRRLAEVGIRDAGVAERYPFELSGACASAWASPPPWPAIRRS